MSKMHIILLAVAVLLIIGINAVPLQRGKKVSVCYADGSASFTPTVFGLPFGYYSYVKGAQPCANLDDWTPGTPNTIDYGKGRLHTAELWFDLMIWGAALLGLNYVLDRRKAK